MGVPRGFRARFSSTCREAKGSSLTEGRAGSRSRWSSTQAGDAMQVERGARRSTGQLAQQRQRARLGGGGCQWRLVGDGGDDDAPGKRISLRPMRKVYASRGQTGRTKYSAASALARGRAGRQRAGAGPPSRSRREQVNFSNGRPSTSSGESNPGFPSSGGQLGQLQWQSWMTTV